MNKQLSQINGNQVVGGVNFLGTIALAAVTLKSVTDIKKKIAELQESHDEIRKFMNDQNRKQNVNLNILNQRLENQEHKLRRLHNLEKNVPKITVVDEEEDEVESAYNHLMGN